MSTTTTLSGTPSNRPAGRLGTLPWGMVTTTTSPPRAASATGTAVAPVSAARSASVPGPRELATRTSCPSARRRRVRVPPIWPAPMMPILMSASQVHVRPFAAALGRERAVVDRLPQARPAGLARVERLQRIPILHRGRHDGHHLQPRLVPRPVCLGPRLPVTPRTDEPSGSSRAAVVRWGRHADSDSNRQRAGRPSHGNSGGPPFSRLRRPGPALPTSSTAGQGFVASWDASAPAGCSRRLLAVASPCMTGGRRG